MPSLFRSLSTALVVFSTFATIALLDAPASAQQVWNNGTPPSGGFGSNISSFAEADDFTLSSGTTLTAVRFWISPGSANLTEFSGNVGWAIHANSGGSVGATLASGLVTGAGVTLTTTGVPNGIGFNFRQVDFSITPTAFAAGTYWLELREGAINSAFDGTSTFAAQSSLQQGALARFDDNETAPTFPNSDVADVAFQLFGTTTAVNSPEPTSLALLVLGTTAGAMLIRRHRKG